MTQIEIGTQAEDDLHSLGSVEEQRVREKLREINTNEFRDITDYDIEHLEMVASPPEKIYRLRVGDSIRVLFILHRDKIAFVFAVGKRNNLYDSPDQISNQVSELQETGITVSG